MTNRTFSRQMVFSAKLKANDVSRSSAVFSTFRKVGSWLRSRQIASSTSQSTGRLKAKSAVWIGDPTICNSNLYYLTEKMWTWAILIPLACSIFRTTLADPAIPPPLWCDDPSLASKVGVLDQCKAYNTSAYGKKIKLTLLYEALCPDCQVLIKDVLYPQVWKNGKDFIDIELVPYGNARHTAGANGTYKISCQHGAEECKLNKLHSCVIHQLEDVSRWFPFIYCLEKAISGGEEPEKATKQCYTQLGVKPSEQAKITECTQGPQGDQLQKAAADRTDAVVPDQHEFVPWFLVNDVSLLKAQVYQNILFSALCSWYRGDKIPPGCNDFLRAARQNKCMH